MTNPVNPVAYNTRGAIPFAFATVFWLPIEIGIFLIILLSASYSCLSCNPSHIVVLPFAAVTSLEIIKRSHPVSEATFRFALSIAEWLGRASRYTRDNAIRLAYSGLTTILLLYLGGQILQTAQAPLSPLDQQSTALLAGLLALATAVLALLLAGVALVLQLILTWYPANFSRAFTSNWRLVLSFLLSASSAVFAILVLRFGANQSMLNIAVALGIYLIASIPLLLALIFDFSRGDSVVSAVASSTIAFIRRTLPLPRQSFTISTLSSSSRQARLDRLEIAARVHMKGEIPSPAEALPQISVPDAFQAELKERTRHMLSACTKAIAEDQRERVLVTLGAIERISSAYTQQRKNYSSMEDQFHLFLATEFELLFTVALTNRNQQYTSDVISTVGRIALSTLDLTPTQYRPNENGIVPMYATLLRRSAIDALPLKFTNASIRAYELLGEVGERLVLQGALTTAIHSVVGDLRKAAEALSPMTGLWPSANLQGVLAALVKIHWSLYSAGLNQGHYYEFAAKEICEAYTAAITKYFSQDRDYLSALRVSGSLVGRAQAGTLVNLFCSAITLGPSSAHKARNYLMRDLADLIRVIRMGAGWSLKSAVSSDFAAGLSEIAWCCLQAREAATSPSQEARLDDLLSEILKAANGIIKSAVDVRIDSAHDLFEHISPLYAFLLRSLGSDSGANLLSAIEGLLRELMDIFSSTKGKSPGALIDRQLRNNLRLFGAWAQKIMPSSAVSEEIADVIARSYGWLPSYALPSIGRSEFESLGYPSGLFQDTWWPFPSTIWGAEEQRAVADLLNDLKNYRRYSQKVDALQSE